MLKFELLWNKIQILCYFPVTIKILTICINQIFLYYCFLINNHRQHWFITWAFFKSCSVTCGRSRSSTSDCGLRCNVIYMPSDASRGVLMWKAAAQEDWWRLLELSLEMGPGSIASIGHGAKLNSQVEQEKPLLAVVWMLVPAQNYSWNLKHSVKLLRGKILKKSGGLHPHEWD